MVYQSYQDPTLNRNLKMGFWLFRNRYQLYRIGIGVLIAVISILWIIVLVEGVRLFQGIRNEQALLTQLSVQRIPTEEIHASIKPQDLFFGPTEVVPSSSQSQALGSQIRSADFFSMVDNTNREWAALVTYRYVWGGGTSIEKQVSILPREQSILPVFGATVVSLPNDAVLDVINIQWKRMRNAEFLDTAQRAREQVQLVESTITPSTDSTLLEYQVKNDGVYTLLDPTFVVVLTRIGGVPIAIAQHTTDRIDARETLNFQQRWLRVLPASAEVMIYPLVDFLDPETYRKPTGDGIQL